MIITIRQPDDFHVHLRQMPQLVDYVRDLGANWGRVLVMPNTVPAITTAADLVGYRAQIEAAGARFTPLMTFKLQPSIAAAEVARIAKAGAVAGKYYPQGVTTNSADGISDVRSVYPVIAAMQDHDLVLCIHGESPEAFCLDREQAFLPVVKQLCSDFPRLRIVLEHISTAAAVAFVESMGEQLVATITAHHLAANLNDMLGGHLRPHLFCKPLLKRPEDQAALVRAAISTNPKFFFGSDSAPHARAAKESDCGCAGVYSAPVALPVLAAVFEAANALTALEGFSSVFGARFYRLPANQAMLTLVRKPFLVPQQVGEVVPYAAGETLSWRLESVG